MTTNQIAARLRELCEKGEFETAQTELFAADALSIEPFAGNGFERETRGLPAIRAKAERWNSMVETYHGTRISEPIVAAHSFALTMDVDVTMKGGARNQLSEICLYKIRDGKIISEEFIM